MEVNYIHSKPEQYVEVSGQHHIADALPLRGIISGTHQMGLIWSGLCEEKKNQSLSIC
jgi:hypothetical protein